MDSPLKTNHFERHKQSLKKLGLLNSVFSKGSLLKLISEDLRKKNADICRVSKEKIYVTD